MKKLKAFVLTALVAGMIGTYTPALAQDSPETRASTEQQSGDDTNYSWIGLLGLVGLAGLMKRNKDVHSRETSSPKYTT